MKNTARTTVVVNLCSKSLWIAKLDTLVLSWCGGSLYQNRGAWPYMYFRKSHYVLVILRSMLCGSLFWAKVVDIVANVVNYCCI